MQAEFKNQKRRRGKLYAKFFLPLVNSLGSRYSYADREDAVEEAFHKLMHLKSREAYGDNLPGCFERALRVEARTSGLGLAA